MGDAECDQRKKRSGGCGGKFSHLISARWRLVRQRFDLSHRKNALTDSVPEKLCRVIATARGPTP
jgi:hypothetical protein